MTLLPVVAREIRSAARNPFTYLMRVLAVASLLSASLLFALENGLSPNLGGKLFGNLHFALFWAIWVLVPMLTADCVSRERREGTLGLLFLTRLTGPDIVVAKGLAHGLRALTLWLAVLPVVTIPLLLGGVSWTEAVLSVLINWSAMCWALAAGLLASAWSTQWLRAMLRAAVLALAFLLTLGFGAGWILLSILSPAGRMRNNWLSESQLLSGLGFLTDARWSWPNYLRLVPPGQFFLAMGEMTALSLLALALGVFVAGGKTQRAWQEEPPSARVLRLQRTFFTPVLWLGLFRRWMRRTLERNPIGWLEQRTWTGRLVVWAWFAIIISVYSAILTDRYFLRGSGDIHALLAWLLAGSMAIGAAGSFRRERETGLLELLLVSPLSEAQIISGRLRGLWTQFAPTIVMLLGVWCYLTTLLMRHGEMPTILFFGCTYFAVPVIGLFFSLQARSFIGAFLSTLVVALFLPLLMPSLLKWLWWLYVGAAANYEWEMRPSLFGGFCQVVTAGLCWHQLYRRLRGRTFALQRGEA